MNSTASSSSSDETFNHLTIWLYQPMTICIISVTIGTILVFITYFLPAIIIICRIRRERHRLNIKELRRISDFI